MSAEAESPVIGGESASVGSRTQRPRSGGSTASEAVLSRAQARGLLDETLRCWDAHDALARSGRQRRCLALLTERIVQRLLAAVPECQW